MYKDLNHPYGYKIDTNIYKSGHIEQSLSSHHYDKITEISRWVVDTKEKSVREALIKLGWKPPEGK